MKSSQLSACTPFHHTNIRHKDMKKNLFDKENSKKMHHFWYKYPFVSLISHCIPERSEGVVAECSGG